LQGLRGEIQSSCFLCSFGIAIYRGAALKCGASGAESKGIWGEDNWEQRQNERSLASLCLSESPGTAGCLENFPQNLLHNQSIAPVFTPLGSTFIFFARATD
jgi:hypothetical protein